MTIDALPDNALLGTFEFYLGKDDPDHSDYRHPYDGWQKLVCVCRRWRWVVFTSPRRLDLKLFCTGQRSVNSKTLDIWPALPIVVVAEDMGSEQDVTNVIAALRHHNRVCKISCRSRQLQNTTTLLKGFGAIDGPFPALTSLKLIISFGQNVPVLPDSFLGGSAPRLRSLDLEGIPYPSIGKLLSSTTNLVRLSLSRIPHSGYIPPKTIIPCLSALLKLESLELRFQYPRPLAHRATRHPPPLTRLVFPNLTSLDFRGDIEYLEDILSQIETPILNKSHFRLFNQLVFDTPLFGQFIRRTETFKATHTASVKLFCRVVVITLSNREQKAYSYSQALRLEIICKPLDWQLSALAQVLNSFSSSLSTLESLEIEGSHDDWQDEIEAIQWQEFLHSFTSVREMTLGFKDSVRRIAPALQELAGEGATEVLPALQNIFLRTYDWRPSGSVKEAIGYFIATRQLYGNPVNVLYQENRVGIS